MGAKKELGTNLDDLRASHIAASTEGVAAGHPRRFAQAVKAASTAAAAREDLPAVVDINRRFAQVPAPGRAQANDTMHRGRWMAARRALLLRELLPRAA